MSNHYRFYLLFLVFFLLLACTATVKIQAPKQPITIDLNVKVEQEIRINVEKDVENLFKNKNIF